MYLLSKLYFWLFAKYKGSDAMGNNYYVIGEKRYVLYRDHENMKVAEEWFAWLYGQSNTVLRNEKDGKDRV